MLACGGTYITMYCLSTQQSNAYSQADSDVSRPFPASTRAALRSPARTLQCLYLTTTNHSNATKIPNALPGKKPEVDILSIPGLRQKLGPSPTAKSNLQNSSMPLLCLIQSKSLCFSTTRRSDQCHNELDGAPRLLSSLQPQGLPVVPSGPQFPPGDLHLPADLLLAPSSLVLLPPLRKGS